jgi:hypothetical protein
MSFRQQIREQELLRASEQERLRARESERERECSRQFECLPFDTERVRLHIEKGHITFKTFIMRIRFISTPETLADVWRSRRSSLDLWDWETGSPVEGTDGVRVTPLDDITKWRVETPAGSFQWIIDGKRNLALPDAPPNGAPDDVILALFCIRPLMICD